MPPLDPLNFGESLLTTTVSCSFFALYCPFGAHYLVLCIVCSQPVDPVIYLMVESFPLSPFCCISLVESLGALRPCRNLYSVESIKKSIVAIATRMSLKMQTTRRIQAILHMIHSRGGVHRKHASRQCMTLLFRACPFVYCFEDVWKNGPLVLST